MVVDDHRAHRERRRRGHARLDAAFARHAAKWMKLSGPKLRDRLDLWVAKFDPAGVRVPPEVEDNRLCRDRAGRARGWPVSGATCTPPTAPRWISAWMRWRPPCATRIRAPEQRRADALRPAGPRSSQPGAVSAVSDDCPAAAERYAAAAAVIHVLAEQATLDGSSDTPGYLPGFGVLPAESVRELATTATLKPLTVPTRRARAGYRPSAALANSSGGGI